MRSKLIKHWSKSFHIFSYFISSNSDVVIFNSTLQMMKVRLQNFRKFPSVCVCVCVCMCILDGRAQGNEKFVFLISFLN